jgi:glycosidase
MTEFFDTTEWMQDAIFYQVFPERFSNGDPENDPPEVKPWGTPPTSQNFMGGDLQGLLDKLPYLQELGINAIYMTPIFTAQSNHKYDTTDYLQVDPAFGDRELLKKLIHSAHENGIRVIFDAVFNHCGNSFWAFKDVMARGRESEYYDWFILEDQPAGENFPNYQTCGGAPFLPKLNTTHPAVRQYLLKVAAYWMKETNLDGWRLDVPWKVPMDFWQEFRQVVKNIRPDAIIVAETWRDTAHWLQGDTCDSVMNYPFRDYVLDYCIRDTMDAEDFDYFVTRLHEVYGDIASMQLNLLGSHDTARLLTLCQGVVSRAILAYICLFTSVGAPMVYYGDENGMLGENDPDCRRCMKWESSDWNIALRAPLQKLITLRKNHPALRQGHYESLLTFNGVYAYRRILNKDQVIVITNPREMCTMLHIPIPGETAAREWVDALSGKRFISHSEHLLLPKLAAQEGLVLIPFDQ